MSFVFPTFLYALFALAIPIIIHLFNFRKYKKVYFTNVKFLRELKQESQSKSRLKELLILAARILAITCLVFAFAQPVLVDKTARIKTGQKTIGIYIDNSFSMEGVNKNGTLLADAKKRANEIISAFGNSDQFMLLTNDFEGKHQRLLSKEEITDAVNDVKISAAVKPLSSVIKRQNDFLKSSKARDLRQFIISDFQKSVSDFKNLNADTLINTTLIPISANSNNNVYIDTCWFETPVQQKGMIQKLNIRIWNKSNQAVENGTIKLFINKQQIALASYNAEAYSKAETKMTFECKEAGFNFCSLKIEDYPIVFDDELFFTFNSRPNIPVLVINGTNSRTGTHFKTLMQNDSLFRFHESNEQSIDYALFPNSNLIILNEIENYSSGLVAELVKYVNNGGYLTIIPSAKANVQNYNEFYKNLGLPMISGLDTGTMKVEKTDFKTGFYEGVFDKIDERMDLPVIRKHYTYTVGAKNNINPVMKLVNGETWMGELPFKNARVYTFSGALDENFTNFCRHALFVPTIYKMAISSLKPTPLYYYTQNNSVISVNIPPQKGDEPLHLSEVNKKFDIIPEMRISSNRINIYTQNQITDPGFYKLSFKGNDLLSLAFNYNRLESGLEFYNADEIENNLSENKLISFKSLVATEKPITASVQEISGNVKLWKLFIIFTLVFIAIEIALIRFLR